MVTCCRFNLARRPAHPQAPFLAAVNATNRDGAAILIASTPGYDCCVSSLPGKDAHPRKAALDAATRASDRSATVVHREMKRGLNSLATIASIAPWTGLFGTVLGLMNSFQGANGSKETIMAVFFSNASQAFVPTALGLLVAVTAFYSYKRLSADLESFNVEMEGASLQLTNDLAVYLGRRIADEPA